MKILIAKKSDPKSDTTALEKEIDQLVYQLYGLTEEEIKTVSVQGVIKKMSYMKLDEIIMKTWV
jgi:hypothetical protein